MKFEGIIFDLDGTLVNSLDDLADSMNEILRNAGYPVHDVETYKYFIGNGIRNLVKKALPEECRDEETVSSYHKLMTATYRKNCLVKSQPYPGIIGLLDELKMRKLKLAVLSNKADELTKKIIEALLPGYFDIVIGMTSEEYRKPNPAGALEISKRWSIRPKHIAYIGDTSTDMQTAKNAGMFAVGVTWGFRTKEELLESGAKMILDKPAELSIAVNL